MSHDTVTLTIDVRPVRSEDVTFRAVGSEYLLVHMLQKQYHVLNAVAARVWALMAGEIPVREIAQAIADEYGEDPERVQQDVLETVQGFEALGLVRVL